MGMPLRVLGRSRRRMFMGEGTVEMPYIDTTARLREDARGGAGGREREGARRDRRLFHPARSPGTSRSEQWLWRAEPESGAGARVVGSPAADSATGTDLEEAERFLLEYHTACLDAGGFRERWKRVRREVERTGSYTHTAGELRYGVRAALRRHGRRFVSPEWRGLRVRDERALRTPRDIHHSLVDHLRAGTAGGAVRATVTVLPPLQPDGTGIRIGNEWLVGYAGWRRPDGTCIGDSRTADFTDLARRSGWTGGSGGPFDVLPLIIDVPGYRTHLAELPAEAVVEIPLTHPGFAWFAELGLRWPPVPVVSDLLIDIGGVRYPAPFNGGFPGIGSGLRAFADPDRYDALPLLARRLDLHPGRTAEAWRAHALLEMHRAFTYSFASLRTRRADVAPPPPLNGTGDVNVGI